MPNTEERDTEKEWGGIYERVERNRKETGRNTSPLAEATCIWEYGGGHGQMMECVIDRHHQMLVTTLHHGVIIIISNIVIITIIAKITISSIIVIIISFYDQHRNGEKNERKWREIEK